MDWEDDLYEQDPPEWVERSDDYNVFEERQLDADRDAGEYEPDPLPEPNPVASVAYADIVRHVGHEIEVFEYARGESATIECLDCGEVIGSADRPE